MLKIFMDEFAPKLNPENTGLLLVHAINPYGMKNRRRYNENNADLNRNFLWDENFDPKINPDYEPLTPLLNPARPIANLLASDIAFIARLIGRIVKLGILRIRQGTLSGQYRHPRGIQFGGESTQESTQVMRGLFQRAIDEYEQVVHLDMHTGYGPRYQMSMVNSALDKGTSEYFEKRFNYPLVVAATADEFYSIRGDMIDYIYGLQQRDYPTKKIYATSFEFGTLGDTLYGLFQSPRVMIHENRAYWHGAVNDKVHAEAKRGFEELFNPSATDWKEKAVKDAEQAFEGILKAEGYM